jgi:hypothetical protein
MLATSLANRHDIAQQTLIESALLQRLVEGLREALAWQIQGDDFSRKLSTVRFISKSFQRHLERLMRLEEVDGYMDIVLEAKPSLSRTVPSLREDHHRFRQMSGQFVRQLEQVTDTDFESFMSTCHELSGLLDDLDRHHKKEAKLFQEAFEQEEGGEG